MGRKTEAFEHAPDVIFNLRFGQINDPLKRIASWLAEQAADALVGTPAGFKELEERGARPSQPHNWDAAFRQYAP